MNFNNNEKERTLDMDGDFNDLLDEVIVLILSPNITRVKE